MGTFDGDVEGALEGVAIDVVQEDGVVALCKQHHGSCYDDRHVTANRTDNGTGGAGVIKTWTEVAARVRVYMLTFDPPLVPAQFSHWLQVRKVAPLLLLLLFRTDLQW